MLETASYVDIAAAVTALSAGRVVALPTETVYGLAASLHSNAAIQNIFEIKSRPFFDPLIVHIGRIEDLAPLVKGPVSDCAKLLMEHFWPGPLTFVFPKSDQVSDLITSGLPTVAVRMPRHPIALEIAKVAGPYAAPSANRFGKTSPTTAEHVRAEFPEADFLIVDGGDSEVGIESTVVDTESSQDVIVLRPGVISAEEMGRVTGRVVRSAVSSASPGHTPEHYQPEKPLYILGKFTSSAVLDDLRKFHGGDGGELALGDDPLLAARTLYKSLRVLSTQYPFLYVKAAPYAATGIWSAIWDRLSRAQSPLPMPSTLRKL